MFRQAVAIAVSFGLVLVAAAGFELLRNQVEVGWLLGYCVAAILIVAVLANLLWDWTDRNPAR
jgi:hypothetical protein